MQILGFNIVKYFDKKVTQLKDNFVYENAEFTKHMLYGIENDKYYLITLRKSEGECPSGYTTACWAHMKIEEIDKDNNKIPQLSYMPNCELICVPSPLKYKCEEEDDDDKDDKDKEFVSNVFSYSHNGGCCWYPKGFYCISDKLFPIYRKNT